MHVQPIDPAKATIPVTFDLDDPASVVGTDQNRLEALVRFFHARMAR